MKKYILITLIIICSVTTAQQAQIIDFDMALYRLALLAAAKLGFVKQDVKKPVKFENTLKAQL